METNASKDPSPRQIHRIAIGLNVIVQIFVAIVIVGMLNLISFRQYLRWDFSLNHKYALSSLTKNVLGQLDAPVKAIVFVPVTYPIFSDISNLLTEYQYASKKKMTVEYVDPFRHILRAKELADKYKTGGDEAIVILDFKGKTKFVRGQDMVELDQTPTAVQRAPIIKAFKGEEVMTSALMGLTEEKQNKLYFLSGHGEPAVNGPQIATFRRFVERENISLQALILNNETAVPAEASAICIFGPKSDLSERELSLLGDYWNERKGRLLLLLDPTGKTPHLVEWLRTLGVTAQGDRIIKAYTMDGITRGLPATGVFLPSAREILKDISGRETQMLGSAESLELDRTKALTDKIRLTELLEADEGFWGETNLDTDGNVLAPLYFNPKEDHMGPLTMAAAVEKGGLDDPRVKVETSRMVVVGNAGFLTEEGLRIASIGLDFGLNCLNWVLNREKMAGIAPKSTEHIKLSLDENHLSSIFLITVVLIPVFAGLVGLYVTWLRQGWSLMTLTGLLAVLVVSLAGSWYLTKWLILR